MDLGLSKLRLVAAVAASAIASAVFVPSASAITVTSTGEGGCSLREAVAAVNTGNSNGPCGAIVSGGTTPINLPSNTYTISQGQILIGAGANLEIIGANPNAPALTTIDAGQDSRVFEVAAGGVATITGVRITGGRTANGSVGAEPSFAGTQSAPGGGILNKGSLTLDRVILTGNQTGDGGPGADGNGLSPDANRRAGGSGNRSGDGGGIHNDSGATLVVTSSIISDNGTGDGGEGGEGSDGNLSTAFNGGSQGGLGAYSGDGGGISNRGTATVSGTTISENFTGRGGNGGGGGSGSGEDESRDAGTGGGGGSGGSGGWAYTDINGSPDYRVTQGGGGIYNATGGITISGSTISGNATGAGGRGGQGGAGGVRLTGFSRAGGNGGFGGSGGLGAGLLNTGSGTVSAQNVTVTGNQAGDGASGGTGGQSTFSSIGGRGGEGGYGGGVWAGGATAIGSTNLTHVTIAGNFIGAGGFGAAGSPPGGGNSPSGARGRGAGLATGPRGGGAPNGLAGVQLRNSIIAENGNPNLDLNCQEQFEPARNDIEDLGGNLTWAALVDTSCPGLRANPNLGLLADNGGPTQTMALGSGSAAIGAIASASCVGTTDQRGFPRPGTGQSSCDIGAYEDGAPPGTTPTTTTLTSSANPSIAGRAVTYTATISPSPSGGTTDFTDGGAVIPGCADRPLVPGGQATCTVTYGFSSSHTIVAVYEGNSLFAPSTSSPLTQVVSPAPVDPPVTGPGPVITPPTPPVVTPPRCKKGFKLKSGRCVRKPRPKKKK